MKIRTFLNFSIILTALSVITACSGNDNGTPVNPAAPPGGRWHENYAVAAHALGTVRGRTETNSREAFVESYESGQRVFEADFSLTSDGALVLRHDFEQISYYNLEQIPGVNPVMDYKTFMSTKIKCLYTPLDADGLCKLLTDYTDAYVITDTKSSDPETVRLQFRQLAEAVNRHDSALTKRFIVQIYNTEMLEEVRGAFGCENFIFTVYQITDPDYDAIAVFCAENGIDVMTIDRDRFTPEIAGILHDRGIKVYVHTVNRLDTMKMMTEYGADGFYSDYITPDEYKEVIN